MKEAGLNPVYLGDFKSDIEYEIIVNEEGFVTTRVKIKSEQNTKDCEIKNAIEILKKQKNKREKFYYFPRGKKNGRN